RAGSTPAFGTISFSSMDPDLFGGVSTPDDGRELRVEIETWAPGGSTRRNSILYLNNMRIILNVASRRHCSYRHVRP
ncbi:MAG TPA: hypothetical protein VKZ59_04025, partial [Acidobacteriota bacterium]|nr:hypothetical protein [Acidobacteriota bacterium]